jgi:hypothetical protein
MFPRQTQYQRALRIELGHFIVYACIAVMFPRQTQCQRARRIEPNTETDGHVKLFFGAVLSLKDDHRILPTAIPFKEIIASSELEKQRSQRFRISSNNLTPLLVVPWIL